MTDAEIGYLSAAELTTHYRDRSLSPVEVTAAVLRHIERQEPALNAMVLLTADTAMATARQAEAAYAAGTARKLEGVPVTIKDLQQTKGVPHADGQPHVRGARAGRGHALRRAPARRRVHHARQVHRAGVRLEGGEPKPAHRHHAQPLGARAQRGRVLLGRRGGSGGGVRAAAPGG